MTIITVNIDPLSPPIISFWQPPPPPPPLLAIRINCLHHCPDPQYRSTINTIVIVLTTSTSANIIMTIITVNIDPLSPPIISFWQPPPPPPPLLAIRINCLHHCPDPQYRSTINTIVIVLTISTSAYIIITIITVNIRSTITTNAIVLETTTTIITGN